jgi:predicted secreted protein
MQRFKDPEQIHVTAGERFAIVLSGNGVGGYLWRVLELPPGLTLHAQHDVAPAEAAPGAAGEREFELEAAEPGSFAVRFALGREWESEPARELTVGVTAH